MKKSNQKTKYERCLTTLILFVLPLCLSYISNTESVYRLSFSHTITAQAKTSLGKSNALSRDISYLNYSSFSKSGLIKQLKFEGFTSSEAKYAVENCGANWNKQAVSKANWKKQAVKKARQYLDTMSLSKSGLISQLKFEGFTSAQAKYAAKKVGYK